MSVRHVIIIGLIFERNCVLPRRWLSLRDYNERVKTPSFKTIIKTLKSVIIGNA